MYTIGLLLLEGDGIEMNKQEASHYFKLAADKGHVDSMYKYAKMNEEGDGIPKNLDEAAKYFIKVYKCRNEKKRKSNFKQFII